LYYFDFFTFSVVKCIDLRHYSNSSKELLWHKSFGASIDSALMSTLHMAHAPARMVVSSYADDTIHVWDVNDTKMVRKIEFV
jgi:hypothetical protein